MRRLVIAVLMLLPGGTLGQYPGWVTYSYNPQPQQPDQVAPSTPQTVSAKVGKQAVLASKATGEVAWVWDRRYLPEDQVYHDKAAKTLVVTSGVSATYLVTAVEHQPAKGFVQTEYLVTFTGGSLPPPDPPPPPIDTLGKRMKDAWLTDLKAGKAKQNEFRDVGLIFRESGKFLKLVTTTGEVYKLLAIALDTTVTDGDLPTVKTVVAERLAKVTKKTVPLDDALKAAFMTAFAELSKAIEEAQK